MNIKKRGEEGEGAAGTDVRTDIRNARAHGALANKSVWAVGGHGDTKGVVEKVDALCEHACDTGSGSTSWHPRAA